MSDIEQIADLLKSGVYATLVVMWALIKPSDFTSEAARWTYRLAGVLIGLRAAFIFALWVSR